MRTPRPLQRKRIQYLQAHAVNESPDTSKQMTDHARVLTERVKIPPSPTLLPLLAADSLVSCSCGARFIPCQKREQHISRNGSFEQVPRVRDRGVQRQIRGLRADASTMTPRGAKRKHCEAQELQEEHAARAPPTPSSARRRNIPVRRAPVRRSLR